MLTAPLPPRRAFQALLLSSVLALAGCAGSDDNTAALPEAATAQVAVLETTDLHANLLAYDYFKLAEDKSVGFERTATLRQARADFQNTVLIDNGDTLQGTALAHYQALVNPLACTDKPEAEGEMLADTLKRARARCEQLKIDTTGARLSDVRIHDLRRTMGSWQARTGASMLVIGKSLGHKSQQATAIYARLDLEPVRQAMETAASAILEAAGERETAKILRLNNRA